MIADLARSRVSRAPAARSIAANATWAKQESKSSDLLQAVLVLHEKESESVPTPFLWPQTPAESKKKAAFHPFASSPGPQRFLPIRRDLRLDLLANVIRFACPTSSFSI